MKSGKINILTAITLIIIAERTIFACALVLALGQYGFAENCNRIGSYNFTLQTPCLGYDAVVMWPNYEDFHSFFICNVNRKAVLQNCPPNTYFVYSLQQCLPCERYIPAPSCEYLAQTTDVTCVPISPAPTTESTPKPTSDPTTKPTPTTTPKPTPTTTPKPTPTTTTKTTSAPIPPTPQTTAKTTNAPNPPTDTTSTTSFPTPPSSGIPTPPIVVTPKPGVPTPPVMPPTPPYFNTPPSATTLATV